MKISVRYLRMERAATDSWITFVLPQSMDFNEACDFAENLMPGWEAVSGCPFDPDEVDW